MPDNSSELQEQSDYYIVGSRRPRRGDKVYIIQKKNYGTEEYDLGIVKDVLTGQENHPRGHKVRLENGLIGRVQKFADQPNTTPRQPKYGNHQQTRENPYQNQENLPAFLPDPEDLV